MVLPVLSCALNGLSTNLELFTQKSRLFAARLSLFQFPPQSGDFLPSFWTWSQTLSDYHRLEIWFRMCSEQTLSTNRPTGSALVAYGFLNTRFLSLLFCFCQISKQKPKSEKFLGRYRRKVAPHKRNGWIRPCVYVVLIRAWRRPR